MKEIRYGILLQYLLNSTVPIISTIWWRLFAGVVPPPPDYDGCRLSDTVFSALQKQKGEQHGHADGH